MNRPRDPLNISPLMSRVKGLRSEAQLSPVKVYRANPDGTPGEYLRTEIPKPFSKENPYDGYTLGAI